MSSALPWASSPPPPPTNDATELLRRIEQNTASTLMWLKILVGAVVVLVLINLAFL